MQELTAETSGQDVANMAKKYLTFDEVLSAPETDLVTRHRLGIVKKHIFDQLAKIDL